MRDKIYNKFEEAFGSRHRPITDPEERLKALRWITIGIDNLLKDIESPDFIESLSAPEPEYRDNFRRTLETLDKLSERLLEGIRSPEDPELPEDMDLGDPNAPIRDPLLRLAGFEALKFYTRFVLESIAEGDYLGRISSPDSSAEFTLILRNTFLALGVLTINLSEGLEAERNE